MRALSPRCRAIRSADGWAMFWWSIQRGLPSTAWATRRSCPRGRTSASPSGFALSPDGTRILYSFELTDPDYLAEPVGYVLEWVYSPDFEMVSLPCDPESAQRYLDLQ